MSTQGYLGTLEVSTDDSSYTPVGGVTNTGVNISTGEVDTTELGDDAQNRIEGLFDSGVPLSMHSKPADAGQVLIQNAFLGRTALFFRYRVTTGGAGYKIQARVFGFNLSSQAGNETTKAECTVKGIATPTPVAAS